jgi:uncharacterized protein with FMN-binding domain
MGKSSLSWIAITLTILGTAVTAGHPAWGTITGVALLLLGIGTAVGALPAHGQSEDFIIERRVAGQKISNKLVTLSSAAILAVYVAGYHRTGSAADRFEAQTARRSTAAPIAAGVVAPTAATHGVDTIPRVPRSLNPPLRKENSRASSPAIQTASPMSLPPAPLPTEQSAVTPSAPPAAPATANPVAEPSAPPTITRQLKYKDGTFFGWGYSRHGDIQASVVIQDGQIVSTAIATCATRYSCSWIANLPAQAVERQGPKVDYVSGATQSSNAFSDAVAEALSKASE